jgi:hypothetical protein
MGISCALITMSLKMQGNAAISDTSTIAGLHSCDIRECKLERAVRF